jgi:gliding motility-associated lipoprotein GldH
MKFLKINITIIFLVSLIGCKQLEVHETHTSIPKHSWKSNFSCNGSFEIKDTAAIYNLSIIVRHTDAYKYNNIWLNIGLASPGQKMNFQQMDFSFGNDAGWEGVGMDDIWEVRKILPGCPTKFKKAGTYQYKIYNIMRDDPLNAVLSAGLRVEKLGN